MRSVTNHCETRLENRPGDHLFRVSPAKSKRRPSVVRAVMNMNGAAAGVGVTNGHKQASANANGHTQNGNGNANISKEDSTSKASAQTGGAVKVPVVAAGGENVPFKRARLGTGDTLTAGSGSSTTPNSVAESRIGGGGAPSPPPPAPTPTPTPRMPRQAGLADLADKYTLGRCIGEGTFGQVYRASDKGTGETVALKMIETVAPTRVEYGFPEAVLREIKILRQLRFHVTEPHPNIIMLRNIVLHRQQESTICLVMDYMDIDLHLLLLHKDRKLPQRISQCYLYQLLNAVTFIHANNIIHRDLKPMNIVVNAQHQLKVVDWGLARVFRRDKKIRYENSVCTPWYKSPELVLGADRTTDGYGPPIDMWSVGCIFVEMLWRERGGTRLRRKPFDPHVPAPDNSGRFILPPGFTTIKGPTHLTSPNNLWKVITGKLGRPTTADWPGVDRLKNWVEFSRLGLTNCDGPNVSLGVEAKRESFETELRMAAMPPEAIKLALQLLELNPHKRISAPEAMAHPYFHGGVKDPATGQLVQGGAVAKLSDLEPWQNLDEAHAEKARREQQRQNGAAAAAAGNDNHWKGSGGVDILGAD